MKKFSVLLLIALLELSPVVQAQNTVIRGELAGTGKYMNIAVDGSGQLVVTNASNNQPVRVINTVDAPVPVAVITPNPVPITGSVSVSTDINTVEKSYLYRNITTAGTTVVRTGAGKLKRITVNTPGTLSQLVLYDSVTGSGTKIGTVNTVLGQLSLQYDIGVTNGLTIVTTGTVPADLTVVYW